MTKPKPTPNPMDRWDLARMKLHLKEVGVDWFSEQESYLRARQVVPSAEAMTAPGPNHPATRALQVQQQIQ